MAEGEGQPQNFNPFNDKDDNIAVGDNYEFLTKFATEPSLKHYGYGDDLHHINKNLIYTSLSRKYGEVEQVQIYMEIITLLKRHIREDSRLVPTGQVVQVVLPNNTVAEMALMKREDERYMRFYRTINYFSTRLYAMTSAAAGANGELIKLLKSQFITKEQTIEDKTETKTGIWGRPKKQEAR